MGGKNLPEGDGKEVAILASSSYFSNFFAQKEELAPKGTFIREEDRFFELLIRSNFPHLPGKAKHGRLYCGMHCIFQRVYSDE